MDDSLLNKQPGDGNDDEEEGHSVQGRVAAYQPWRGEELSSDEEEKEDEGPEDEIKEEDPTPYSVLEDDDEFEDFQSAPMAPMSVFTNGEASAAPLQQDEAEKLHEADEFSTKESMPRERLAPLTKDNIAVIKNAMSKIKINRSGPIVGIAKKLEGQRIGDEVNK